MLNRAPLSSAAALARLAAPLCLAVVSACATSEDVAFSSSSSGAAGHSTSSGSSGSTSAGSTSSGSTSSGSTSSSASTGSGGVTTSAGTTSGAGGSSSGGGGSAGSGGAGGLGDASAGGSESGPPVPVSTNIDVKYKTGSATQVDFSLLLTNTGMDMPPTSSFKFRYYFSEDFVDLTDSSKFIFYDAAWKSGSNMAPYYVSIKSMCTAKVAPFTPKMAGADNYFEINCAASTPVGNLDTVEIKFTLQTSGEDPTNDYSYAALKEYASNPHLVVLQGDTVVSGLLPGGASPVGPTPTQEHPRKAGRFKTPGWPKTPELHSMPGRCRTRDHRAKRAWATSRTRARRTDIGARLWPGSPWLLSSQGGSAR